MTQEVSLPKSDILTIYSKLEGMMQEHKFDNRMLNMAVLKNARALEDAAEKLRRGRQDIFADHADTWGEGEDVPAGAEVGQMKIQQLPDGRSVPRFKNEEHAEKASIRIDNLFEGEEAFVLKVVPEEAMDIPDGETLDVWSRLEWMFVDDG